MAWLTTLSDERRIIREQRVVPIFSLAQSGSMTDSGGILYTQIQTGTRRFTTYEYPGIAQGSAVDLVAHLETFSETLDAHFQYGEAGGGSIFWQVRVETYDP